MTDQEAIEILKSEKKYSEAILDDFLSYSSGEIKEAKQIVDVCNIAIAVFEEIRNYRKLGRLEELARAKKYINLAKNHETIGEMIDECAEYESIGTVAECREATEKQKPKKCVKDSCPDHTHYKCPSCGRIQLSTYAHRFSRGRIPKFCEWCGQAILKE